MSDEEPIRVGDRFKGKLNGVVYTVEEVDGERLRLSRTRSVYDTADGLAKDHTRLPREEKAEPINLQEGTVVHSDIKKGDRFRARGRPQEGTWTVIGPDDIGYTAISSQNGEPYFNFDFQDASKWERLPPEDGPKLQAAPTGKRDEELCVLAEVVAAVERLEATHARERVLSYARLRCLPPPGAIAEKRTMGDYLMGKKLRAGESESGPEAPG